jgi:hypothetical protein
MSKINNRQEFHKFLSLATERVSELSVTYPKDSFLGSILRQLNFVQQWTNNGQNLKKEDVEKLNFGLMASKSVADIDEDCADLLHELSYFLHHWPDNP